MSVLFRMGFAVKSVLVAFHRFLPTHDYDLLTSWNVDSIRKSSLGLGLGLGPVIPPRDLPQVSMYVCNVDLQRLHGPHPPWARPDRPPNPMAHEECNSLCLFATSGSQLQNYLETAFYVFVIWKSNFIYIWEELGRAAIERNRDSTFTVSPLTRSRPQKWVIRPHLGSDTARAHGAFTYSGGRVEREGGGLVLYLLGVTRPRPAGQQAYCGA